jgi:hypothetical protein
VEILARRHGTFSPAQSESVFVSLEARPMSKRNPTMFPDPEPEAEAIEAVEKAQSLPPGKERTDAQIFTDESRSGENG